MHYSELAKGVKHLKEEEGIIMAMVSMEMPENRVAV